MAESPLGLTAFNRLAPDDAAELVKPCFDVERWWTSVVGARPYADLESLLEVGRRSARPLTRRELELALAAYLDLHLGDWPPTDDRSPLETEESAAQLRERTAEDSRTCLVRFGRPLVTWPAGRSTPATAAALRQIGLLALARRVTL